MNNPGHQRQERKLTPRDLNKPSTWSKKERDAYILRGIRPEA